MGLDPLLVAAPAIGLLAGGVLALRLLPLMAELIERAVARGRHLIGSLGARQLARRPLRYTRAALLLMLAISMGIFAVSYGSTWTDSQQDQAAYQVGTDVRTIPGRGPSSIPPWAQAATFGSLDGVTGATPVRRERLAVTRAAGAGELIGLRAGGIGRHPVPRRPGLGPAQRPARAACGGTTAAGADRAAGPARPPAGWRGDRHHLGGPPGRFNPRTGEASLVPVRLSLLDGRPVYGASVVLRDGDGLLHRFTAEPVPLNPDGPEQVEVEIRAPDTLAAGADDLPLHMTGPITIVEIGLQAASARPGLRRRRIGHADLAGVERCAGGRCLAAD